MTEQFRKHYFLAVRMLLMLVSEGYLLVWQFGQAGASGMMLLLLALFFAGFVAQELLSDGRRGLLLLLLAAELGGLVYLYGREFFLPGIWLAYEGISWWKSYLRDRKGQELSALWYFLPALTVLIPGPEGVPVRLLITLFGGIVYIQHDYIIASYRSQLREETHQEHKLKKHMHRREQALQEELKHGLLLAENRMLEERANLAQVLHDKLGHNINGSVYQLEAVKVLMEREPETGRKMLQVVIDQLRTGMDEIREILRQERPEKYKLALLQLERLCEQCRGMGIEAQLVMDGDLSGVPETYLEIVLDNAFEAVSNALKYARCTRIDMKLVVMNRMLRCSISDNGVGCQTLTDGMGIAGMRRRVREAGGILDFDTEQGFTINMLLPLDEGRGRRQEVNGGGEN